MTANDGELRLTDVWREGISTERPPTVFSGTRNLYTIIIFLLLL